MKLNRANTETYRLPGPIFQPPGGPCRRVLYAVLPGLVIERLLRRVAVRGVAVSQRFLTFLALHIRLEIDGGLHEHSPRAFPNETAFRHRAHRKFLELKKN
jgi:hypothetical protein